MRRDANFGIGDAVIQVKEERETDKSGYFGIYIAEIQKKLERETDINFVSWIAEIQLSSVYSYFIFIFKK